MKAPPPVLLNGRKLSRINDTGSNYRIDITSDGTSDGKKLADFVGAL